MSSGPYLDYIFWDVSLLCLQRCILLMFSLKQDLHYVKVFFYACELLCYSYIIDTVSFTNVMIIIMTNLLNTHAIYLHNNTCYVICNEM